MPRSRFSNRLNVWVHASHIEPSLVSGSDSSSEVDQDVVVLSSGCWVKLSSEQSVVRDLPKVGRNGGVEGVVVKSITIGVREGDVFAFETVVRRFWGDIFTHVPWG